MDLHILLQTRSRPERNIAVLECNSSTRAILRNTNAKKEFNYTIIIIKALVYPEKFCLSSNRQPCI